jgi:hypothetical protein
MEMAWKVHSAACGTPERLHPVRSSASPPVPQPGSARVVVNGSLTPLHPVGNIPGERGIRPRPARQPAQSQSDVTHRIVASSSDVETTLWPIVAS